MNLFGLNKILHPETDKRTGTDRFLSNLASSNIGTVQNSMNASGTVSSKDSFSISTNLSEILSPSCGMSEEEKEAYLARIRAKLKNGHKLTGEEMRFLQAEDPELYMQASRVQSMRESLEQQLQGCDSKEEAAEIFSRSMSMIGEKDPMKEYIVAAYENVYEEFQKSDEYKALPETKEDADASGKADTSEKADAAQENKKAVTSSKKAN